MNISRRKAIGTAGLAVGAFLAGQFSSVSAEKPQKEEAVEWKPVKLDPKKVAARAYEIYPEGSCMYAAFTAIATAMAEAAAKVNPALSQALKNFPCQMFKYGHSGLGGQGTLCGAVNGACAIFGLFVHDKAKLDTLTAELCGYYETTELPIFKPKSSKFEPMPASVSGSVPCVANEMVRKIRTVTVLRIPQRPLQTSDSRYRRQSGGDPEPLRGIRRREIQERQHCQCPLCAVPR